VVSKAIASRIGKLAEIAQELREGERFEITRLTRTYLRSDAICGLLSEFDVCIGGIILTERKLSDEELDEMILIEALLTSVLEKGNRAHETIFY
jgi:hypothetical protein